MCKSPKHWPSPRLPPDLLVLHYLMHTNPADRHWMVRKSIDRDIWLLVDSMHNWRVGKQVISVVEVCDSETLTLVLWAHCWGNCFLFERLTLITWPQSYRHKWSIFCMHLKFPDYWGDVLIKKKKKFPPSEVAFSTAGVTEEWAPGGVMWYLHMARECLGPVWWWQALIWGVWRPPKSLGAIVALICACGVMVDWDWAVVSVLAFRGWWWWWGWGLGWC